MWRHAQSELKSGWSKDDKVTLSMTGRGWGGRGVLRVYCYCRGINEARSDKDTQVFSLLPSSRYGPKILICALVTSKRTGGWLSSDPLGLYVHLGRELCLRIFSWCWSLCRVCLFKCPTTVSGISWDLTGIFKLMRNCFAYLGLVEAKGFFIQLKAKIVCLFYPLTDTSGWTVETLLCCF